MIFNFGSINLDLVYRVPHMPQPGETLASLGLERFLGGKGINQSIAVARAGGGVRHIGCLGPDGAWLRDEITHDLATDDLRCVDIPTGHAIIYVDTRGENQIVLFPGANRAFDADQIDGALATAAAGDWVMVQNETNLVAAIAARARGQGLRVCYSAAPFDADEVAEVLPHIDLLALNGGEAAALENAMGQHPSALGLPYLMITHGADGAELHSGGDVIRQAAFPVTPVDTTGAGDTFLGAFMARFAPAGDAAAALRFAAAAAALQVTRAGAAAAIPTADEVAAFLAEAEE
ncbi:MAG: ribokinase [Pseudomonadota bacterium]